jgi:hypothetical protein
MKVDGEKNREGKQFKMLSGCHYTAQRYAAKTKQATTLDGQFWMTKSE